MGKLLEKIKRNIKSKLKNALIIIVAVVVGTAFVTYPALCGAMGLGFQSAWDNTDFIYSLVSGLVVGLVVGLVFGLDVGLDVGLVFGLGGGLVFGLVVGLDVELVFGLASGLAGGLVFGLVSGLVFGLVVGLVFGLDVGLHGGFAKGFYIGFGVAATIMVGSIFGVLLSYALKNISNSFISAIKGFFGSREELRRFSFLGALCSFLVGYVVIVLIFSLWFYACYLEDLNEYFKIGWDATWWDFIYYSFVTITTLGYGDITPLKAFPQFLVMFESTIGVMLPAIFIGILLHLSGKKAETPRNIRNRFYSRRRRGIKPR